MGEELRISASKLMREVWTKNKVHLQSVNAVMGDWQLAEMQVCASFMTACNSGPIDGCSLEELITRFVAELVVSETVGYVYLEQMKKIDWGGSFNGQFIFPFDTTLPREVCDILKCLESTRPPNQMMFDAGTFERTSHGKMLKLLIEVKTTTKELRTRDLVRMALKRQDSHAKVSFIVVNSSAANLKNFKLNDIRCLNRSKSSISEGGLLSNTRLFRLDIDPNRRVIRTPLDGKVNFNSAKRLIFLISLADINRQVQMINRK
jgi:hypothetical protein